MLSPSGKAAAILAERWITLEGPCNVRDLGGLRTVDGRTTRHGVLIRSDALDQLSQADVSLLSDTLGIRHVIDLRSANERAEQGRSRLADDMDIRYTEVEVISAEALAVRRRARQVAHERGDDPAETMAADYLELLRHGTAAFRQAVQAITAEGGTPAIFHCSAGKDRTGILAALVLDAVGVSRDVIVADYCLTNTVMPAIIERLNAAKSFGDIASQLRAFDFTARAETLAAFFRHLDSEWGSGAGYIEATGVDPRTVARLGELLINSTQEA